MKDTGLDFLSPYSGVRVLVAGASGFIGRWVARLLSQAGADLWLLSRDPGALGSICHAYSIRGKGIFTSLDEPQAFRRAYQVLRPAVTFNLVGYGVDPNERDSALAQALNAQLVGEMAETIAATNGPRWEGLRMIHVGSAFEYGPIRGVVSEDSEPVPETVYGKSKLEGTRKLQDVCRRTGLRAATARIFTVYGPGEHHTRLLPSLLRAARTGEHISLTPGEQKRDFTYVKDVAEGLLRLALVSEVPGHVVNLATGRLTSVRSFAKCASGLLRLKPDQLRFGAIPYRGDELWQGRADVSRLERLLGWKPACTVREGIKQTIEFEPITGALIFKQKELNHDRGKR